MNKDRDRGDDRTSERAEPPAATTEASGAAVATLAIPQIGRLDQALELNCRSHRHQPMNRPSPAA
ncbi:hypothetical protein [Paractinoplanes toevensis]|uniref:hypothetical protein n=1 Tax=Paractinoplanes toevensis TaxID=571911 RepID=UPI001BB2F24B|nr:hypothetical protein [Actinoplanes toevensis]